MENKRKKRVLMTFMESGLGHITSIRSISDNLKAICGDDFEIIDSYIMQEDNDKTLLSFEKFIIKQTKNTNRIKGFGNFVFAFITIMGGVHFMRFLHRTVFRPATTHCLRVFKKHAPDVIVSTHYFMTFAALEYKKKINPNVTVITYNPDNNVHIWWDNRPHLFLVNNKNAYNEAIGKRKFIPALTKQVNFTARNDIVNANLTKEEYRNVLNIPREKFCVIVADGVYACGKSKKVTKELLKSEKEMTIIMLAGKNKKVENYFNNLKERGKVKPNIDLIVLPFTKYVYEYYKASDVFVTKAGPNAILDSVFMNTPVVVDMYAHPIEKATTKLFVDTLQMGKAIYNPKLIRLQIESWIENRESLNILANNTKKIDKFENGGKECARLIKEEIERTKVFDGKNDYENLLYSLAIQEKYDVLATPTDFNNAKKVNMEEFRTNNFGEKLRRFFVGTFLHIFGPIINFVGFRLKIEGKKNLRNIKSAILVSNHTHALDSLWKLQASNFSKNMFSTGAQHNNKKGFLGRIMKSGGYLPMPATPGETKEFLRILKEKTDKGALINFCPEQSMWKYFKQSRPLKRGAFYFASELNSPVIPMFAFFSKTKLFKHKKVVLKIFEPIYPNKNLNVHQNSKYLQSEAQKVYDQAIVDFYGYDKKTYQMNKVNKKIKK